MNASQSLNARETSSTVRTELFASTSLAHKRVTDRQSAAKQPRTALLQLSEQRADSKHPVLRLTQRRGARGR